MVRMRHPNLVSFMGLCVVPPCILTGKPKRVTLAHSALHERCQWRLLVAYLPSICILMLLMVTMIAVLPAEFCARGSLYDVLRRARQDPKRAAELTWQLRLSMVRA